MTPQHELLWLAIRYVLAELPAGEAEAFDARLADDQAVREAVATAVELIAAYRLAEAEIEVETLCPAAAINAGAGAIFPAAGTATFPAVGTATATTRSGSGDTGSPGSAWMRPVGWISLGAAACLAILLVGQSSWAPPSWAPPTKPSPSIKVASSQSSHSGVSLEVATAWAKVAALEGLHDTFGGEMSLLVANHEVANHEVANHEMVDDDAGDDEGLAPSWMLAALEARATP